MLKQWLRKLWPAKQEDLSSVKVLIIEDNVVDSKMIQKAVDLCGFTALFAYDGKTGIEMARTHKPDLVILDYYLPDIDGGKVLEVFRSSAGAFNGKVIVLTVSNHPNVVINSFLQGTDQYLTKPIRVSFLAKQIKLMLQPPLL